MTPAPRASCTAPGVGSDNTVVSAGGRHTVDDTARNVVVHSLQIVLRYCHYPNVNT